MKIYLDTGVFIDYLSPLILGGINLRPRNRRGRTPAQLSQDAESVLKKIASSHLAATSSLTYYEVEEALFKQFTSVTIGMENASNFRVLAARSIVVQTFNVVRFFGITALDLTSTIVEWLFWFLCGNEVYTDSFFRRIVLKVLPDRYFTIL
ncbi:hypothetical protein [Microcystis aeruginosa]|uniref:Uncharacterized protein n=1 Tax=Microcystis aeruginosa 11-30S32 TaxID=2358142 RepID=A0A510PG51_MICAE|nr:hypothetical protein [Microcystis aeruginosa]GCA92762.1 hypothetical protein [Microcystis aeruginosa 11-30S32]